MELRIIIFGIVLAFMSGSCKAPDYLPKAEEIGANEFGSHITLKLSEGPDIEGELIAVDSVNISVLAKEDNKQLQTIPFANVKSFKIMYAQPEKYGWTIPVSALVSLSHGVFFVITGPANIVVTSLVTARGSNAFTYRDKDISVEELKMFARFPQGIPPDVSPGTIE